MVARIVVRSMGLRSTFMPGFRLEGSRASPNWHAGSGDKPSGSSLSKYRAITLFLQPDVVAQRGEGDAAQTGVRRRQRSSPKSLRTSSPGTRTLLRGSPDRKFQVISAQGRWAAAPPRELPPKKEPRRHLRSAFIASSPSQP